METYENTNAMTNEMTNANEAATADNTTTTENANEAPKASIEARLCTIQTNLKVMKSSYNNYSKYEYRSLEDILAAVKPLLSYTKTILLFHEDLIPIGNTLFMKCTATLKDYYGGEISTSTIIKIDDHKGMCAEQAFGAAISYARKYTASALLLVDGAKDFDTDEVTQASRGQRPQRR